MTDQKNLNGLGGWLILVGIGIVLSPIRLLFLLYSVYLPYLTEGTLAVIISDDSNLYPVLLGPVIIGELVVNIVLLFIAFAMIYLFFTKHHLFPKVFIAVAIFSVIYIPLNSWLASLLFPGEPVFDPETTREFIRALVGTLIWVPYMLVSKRVKATFLAKRQALA